MSHLYTMFAKQVSSYCKNSQDMPTNMCKRNLLMYGINKLQDMNESHLDSMDPYQRGATDISKYCRCHIIQSAWGAIGSQSQKLRLRGNPGT